MSIPPEESIFRGVFSLNPLIQFWELDLAARGEHWAVPFQTVREQLQRNPELMGPIDDLSVLQPHMQLISMLMSAVFPQAFWNSELMAAFVPFSFRPIVVSPEFQRLLLESDGSLRGSLFGTLRGRLFGSQEDYFRARRLRYLFLILREIYGIDEDLEHQLIRVIKDPHTGLDRYFRFLSDVSFVEVHPIKPVKELTDSDRNTILSNLADLDVLQKIIQPENFEFHGFTTWNVMDVTRAEVFGQLEREIIDREALFTDLGFEQLQNHLRVFFGRSELDAALMAIQGERAMLLSSARSMSCNCVFSDSRLVYIDELKDSIFERALTSKKILMIKDLQNEPSLSLTKVEEDLLASGRRSLMIAPLSYQGRMVGTMALSSPHPDDLGSAEELLIRLLQPLFSMAIRRSLDEFANRVDSVIKQKCTAIHPSVEWRFRDAVIEHLDQSLRGNQSELAPIVFKDVYPLYGATDIRGSSEARNTAIKADLCDQLRLALDVVKTAWDTKPLPLLEEMAYRVQNLLERSEQGLVTGDEFTVVKFLRSELEPYFSTIRTFGPEVNEKISRYVAAVDQTAGTVYRRRQDFEKSISAFNRKISSYLDHEQKSAQAMFPHYFEKHQTDGMEYIIYVGSSMVRNGGFNQLYVRSLRLWQIILACGIAWHAEQIKSSLKVPLEATHLILAHHTPLSVRFRFDEKRFDVDGAYDIGHEILRSRIDKAVLKGSQERLTQPGCIAIVYTRPEESQEMVRHIHFLQSQNFLLMDHTSLELEDLPGAQGLRAIRVSVNLDSPELAARATAAE